jgi:hypothetical protein
MLHDPRNTVVVVGVGQHHSCHCWAVSQHMEVVESALRTLLGDRRTNRHVIWFGVPAQPYNTHLYRKKPIGQSRKDCRNNARHLLYAAYQLAALQRWWRGRHREGDTATPAITKPVPFQRLGFIDSFALSLGMQHTTLDGAHYYTWVRDAWIDAFLMNTRRKRGK